MELAGSNLTEDQLEDMLDKGEGAQLVGHVHIEGKEFTKEFAHKGSSPLSVGNLQNRSWSYEIAVLTEQFWSYWIKSVSTETTCFQN